MKRKILFLAYFLFLGALAQQCVKCDCGVVETPFFDIQNIALNHQKNTQYGGSTTYNNTIPLDFESYYGLKVAFEVDYIAKIEMHRPSCFSLFSSAWACDCESPGFQGTKKEKLKSLTILSSLPFNENYTTGDTLNTLFDISHLNQGTKSDLNAFIASDTSLIQSEFFYLHLKEKPSKSRFFQATFIFDLGDGEVYQVESEPLEFN